MAVQTNPHAKALCSQIIYSIGTIFGSGIFLLMMPFEMKGTLELATAFREYFLLSALSEDKIFFTYSPLNKLIQCDTKTSNLESGSIPANNLKHMNN